MLRIRGLRAVALDREAAYPKSSSIAVINNSIPLRLRSSFTWLHSSQMVTPGTCDQQSMPNSIAWRIRFCAGLMCTVVAMQVKELLSRKRGQCNVEAKARRGRERQTIWLGEARAHLVCPLVCLLTNLSGASGQNSHKPSERVLKSWPLSWKLYSAPRYHPLLYWNPSEWWLLSGGIKMSPGPGWTDSHSEMLRIPGETIRQAGPALLSNLTVTTALYFTFSNFLVPTYHSRTGLCLHSHKSMQLRFILVFFLERDIRTFLTAILHILAVHENFLPHIIKDW